MKMYKEFEFKSSVSGRFYDNPTLSCTSARIAGTQLLVAVDPPCHSKKLTDTHDENP
jgi:hypothetical protein